MALLTYPTIALRPGYRYARSRTLPETGSVDSTPIIAWPKAILKYSAISALMPSNATMIDHVIPSRHEIKVADTGRLNCEPL